MNFPQMLCALEQYENEVNKWKTQRLYNTERVEKRDERAKKIRPALLKE